MDFVSENLKNRNFVTFMDGFMDFVSENEKTETLSHLWMVLWMVMCVDYLMVLWILSVRMKKQEFSHLKNQEFCLFYGLCQWEWKNRKFVTFMSVFMDGYVCWLFDGFMDFVSENGKTGTLTLPSCCCSSQMLRVSGKQYLLLLFPSQMLRVPGKQLINVWQMTSS